MDVITTYKHIADGFYEAKCGYCQKHTLGSRSCGWSISGMVVKCSECGKINLILRSDVDEVNKAIFWYYSAQERKYEEIVKEVRKLQEENSQLRGKITGNISHLFPKWLNRFLQDVADGKIKED